MSPTLLHLALVLLKGTSLLLVGSTVLLFVKGGALRSAVAAVTLLASTSVCAVDLGSSVSGSRLAVTVPVVNVPEALGSRATPGATPQTRVSAGTWGVVPTSPARSRRTSAGVSTGARVGLTSLVSRPLFGSMLLAVWLLVGGTLLARYGISLFRLRRLVRDGESSRTLTVWTVWPRRRRKVHVVVTGGMRDMVVFGAFQPVVLVGRGLVQRWSVESLMVALRHELAHVSRGDTILDPLCEAARAVYWWNPLASWLLRLYRRERELACDAEVVRGGVPAIGYARLLLSLARGRAEPAAASLASDLTGRIEALVSGRTGQPPLGGSRRRVVAGVALVLVTISGCLSPRKAPAPPSKARPGATAPLSPQALDAVSRLRSANARERWNAAALLGNEGTSEATPALVARLTDPSARVREYAAAALGNVGDRRAVPDLILRLRDEIDAVRQRAAGALGSLADPGALSDLTRVAVEDANANVRQTAAGALQTMPDARALPSLIQAAGDPDPYVRQVATEALGRVLAALRPDGGQHR